IFRPAVDIQELKAIRGVRQRGRVVWIERYGPFEQFERPQDAFFAIGENRLRPQMKIMRRRVPTRRGIEPTCFGGLHDWFDAARHGSRDLVLQLETVGELAVEL